MNNADQANAKPLRQGQFMRLLSRLSALAWSWHQRIAPVALAQQGRRQAQRCRQRIAPVMLALVWVAPAMVPTAAQAQGIEELATQQQEAQQRRQALHQQIDAVQRQIHAQESQRHDVVDRLRLSERNISELNASLDRLQAQQDEMQAEIEQLRRQADGQRALLEQRRADLSAQLYAQYTAGLSPWAALLSGGDAQKIGRDLGYLSYAAKARVRSVNELNAAIERLQQTESAIQGRQAQLGELRQQALTQRQALEQEQQRHQAALTQIETELQQRRSEAGRLAQDQQRLDDLISGIGRTIAQQREATRQAELERQRLLLQRQEAATQEREAQARIAQEQAELAQQQAQRAEQLSQQAQEAQREALTQQRTQQIQIRRAQNALALDPEQMALAKQRIEEALGFERQTQQQLAQARLQAEHAEIERAKAKVAQERALEAQRLAQQARADERKARQLASSTTGGIPRGAPWPLRGPLQGQFGRQRPDGGVWRGILIKAQAGSPVKSVANGTVVFADWMRGFGNLVIVDHGSEYMSVYGYNQSINAKVGDAVQVGQVIARAGATGGQVEPALYFEIRRAAQPVDPLGMLAK